MKIIFILIIISGILGFQNPFGNHSSSISTGNSLFLSALPSVINFHEAVAQGTPGQTQQASSVIPNPIASQVSTTATPADLTSIIKEIVSSNNQVVSQVASMYQNLGLFITIIVTIVAGITTLLGFLARRSVLEFIQEWTKKLESVEQEMKDSLKRLRDSVSEAEKSANAAAGHARSIEDSEKIMNNTLGEVDRLRNSVQSLHAQISGGQPIVPPLPSEGEVTQISPEPSAADEDAEVAARLQGKINSSEREG